MKAIIVNAYGGPEVLEVTTTEKPEPKSNEVLVKIHATAVTRASVMMRTGTPYFGRLFMGFSKPKVKTPGTDFAGVIEAVGSEVSNFKIGDQVMAATDLNCGAYAEYICLASDEIIINQPENITAEEATGIIDGGVTALSFFTDQVTIKSGDQVLINGASGSIGTAAIQLAKEFGAEVTAVCSGKNAQLAKELGADYVLDYTKNGLENSVQKFDIIFDTVGKLSYTKTKKHMKERSVFLTPVLEFGTLMKMLFVSPFTSKKLKFSATGLRNKDVRMRDLKIIAEMLANNSLKTIIDRVYSLEQIQEAHRYVDAGHKTGNVVVKM
jgi:NADPH:quinone reductase-like Zn-dependent oxidoreductase